ncbi:SGNH/GDSL hydrolase family protein [Microbacterium sp. NPDC089189]|uniref:SGNH/GDSL hydrolase family protein n=1 Tax=Microbacterium sp. NPDC089189 TaxID=3154972 RepID=UPI003427A487
MARTPRSSARRSLGVLAGLAVAIAVVCAVAIWRPWATDPTPVSRADAGGAQAVAVPAIDLPDDPRVLVFGDSWTFGSAASVATLGYAYVLGDLLGGETIVNGSRGSGYLVPGIDGGTFGERIADLDPALDPDLVIVQGSINDRKVPAEGYTDAVSSAWDALSATYPNTPIVILGPAPQVLPVEPATARIDRDLSAAATARGWAYISPIADGWITAADYDWIIDTGEIGRNHPTTEGHAYLAERVAEALSALRAR